MDQRGQTEGYTSVESAPQEMSEAESSIYELVWSTEGHKNPDVGEIDYESDESLDGMVDDLPELGKVFYNTVTHCILVGASQPLSSF